MKLPRGLCRTCGRMVAVRRNGALREHRRDRSLCPNSGRLPNGTKAKQ